MKNIQELGIDVCYFAHSNKAIIHSLDTGIVFQPPAEAIAPIVESKDLQQ
jgi:hypothetical protein